MSNKEKVLLVVEDYIKQGVNLDNVSMQMIADDVGIGKSTLYEYFSSKRELITQAFIHLTQHYHNRLTNIDFKDDFETIFKQHINDVIVVTEEAKAIMEAILQKSSYIDSSNEEIMCEVENVKKDVLSQYEKIFEVGLKEKIISDSFYSKNYQYVIISILTGLTLQYVSKQTHFNNQEIVEFIYQTIVEYLS